MDKRVFLLLSMLVCLAAGCGKGDDPQAPTVQPLDYSNPANWLATSADPLKSVDVFFLYPTAWFKPEPFYCDVSDPGTRAFAAYSLAHFGSCFETAGNLYAPHYRQAGLSILTYSLAEQNYRIDSIPGVDAYAAFDYFITHFNYGRPFIVAAHSQGSHVALRAILGRYMKEHPDVYARMVAAYIIGYSVTQPFLDENPHLKFATGATDLQVIVSYNTEDGAVTGKNPVAWPGALAINPVNWRRDATLATASENLDSRLDPNGDGQFQNMPVYADACIDPVRGVVVCTTVDPADYDLSPLFPLGCLHGGDYPFYYYSLRRNAEDRVAAYLSNLN